MRGPGNRWASRSLNTFACLSYSFGKDGFDFVWCLSASWDAQVCFDDFWGNVTNATWVGPSMGRLGTFTCRGMKRAFAASFVRKNTGSSSIAILPRAQSMFVWLDGCKPWVAEDEVSFSDVGEEKPEQHSGCAMLYTDVGIVSNIPLGVGGSINVDDLSRSFECFDREFHSSCVVHIHEVFGCPAIQ